MQTKNKRQIFAALIAVLISVTLVAVAVYAATTVGNDVAVGGDLTVNGTSTFLAGNIALGTLDGFNRTQIWNHAVDSILRLGALSSDGDGFNTTSDGIIVYGQNVDEDTMGTGNWGYARIKPDRFGLYNNKDTAENYLFRVDLSSDDFYLKDNSGNTVFDFTRATGQLSIDGTVDVTGTTTLALTSGNVGIGTTSPATLLHVSKDSATTTVIIGNESGSSRACLKLRDSDDAGWSYCTILDGTMNCATTSCE